MNKPIISKGIEPMTGWQWIYQHLHDLDGWQPAIEIIREGASYKITAKDTRIMNEAIREIVK